MLVRHRCLVTLTAQLVVLACARSADVADMSARQAAPDLRGEWTLVLDAAKSPTPGLRLTLVIDSATAGSLYGRVAHFLSGNVGIDPAAFLPFQGTLTRDSLVDIPVRPARGDAPLLQLVGLLAGDSVRLRSFVIGRDTLTGVEGRALLIRER